MKKKTWLILIILKTSTKFKYWSLKSHFVLDLNFGCFKMTVYVRGFKLNTLKPYYL